MQLLAKKQLVDESLQKQDIMEATNIYLNQTSIKYCKIR